VEVAKNYRLHLQSQKQAIMPKLPRHHFNQPDCSEASIIDIPTFWLRLDRPDQFANDHAFAVVIKTSFSEEQSHEGPSIHTDTQQSSTACPFDTWLTVGRPVLQRT